MDERDFGKLEAQVEALTNMVSELKTDVKAIKSDWDKASGGFKVMMAIAAIIGAGLSQVVNYVMNKL